LPEAEAVVVPEELDPARVVSLVLTSMTACQVLHRLARAESGESVLVAGAAGRVGTAVLELVGDGVDVALDGLGGATSIRSFRALRRGGRLVVFGHYAPLSAGHKGRRAWAEWYAATPAVALWGALAYSRRVMTYRIQRLRDSRQWLPVAGRRPARLAGVVRGTPSGSAGLRGPARAVGDREDPPRRGRAPAAVAGRTSARAARRVGVEGRLVLVP
jgi:NADPH2:quinone reductase